MTVSAEKYSMSEKILYIAEQSGDPPEGIPSGAARAEIGRNIHFNPAVLDTFDVKGFAPLHYDMFILCAAIEFADRRWKRPLGWCRRISVAIPVLALDRWQRPEVHSALCSALNYLTGDTWRFTFTQATTAPPIGSRQIPLNFGLTKTFAVAYSDGLDSRAVSALSGHPDEALCIRVSRNRQQRRNGDSYFTQIPFRVQGLQTRESSCRSRGFKFAAVTSIAAQLAGVTRIIVPESGQGALGPVLLPLHNIYRDFRNYPIFFRKMERFIEALQGHQVRFEQPRIWSTKAQTLRAFLALPGKSEADLRSTHSCWQTRRVVNVGARKHCGLCAACLLRRLSLHAANVTEAPGTYVVSNLAASRLDEALSSIPQKADRDIMVQYGSVGARHLQQLADMSDWPDDELRAYASQIAAAIGGTCEDALKQLRTMLETHAAEWRAFLSSQGEQSFLKGWMDGGRLG